jgi:hypothetical protein
LLSNNLLVGISVEFVFKNKAKYKTKISMNNKNKQQ